MLLYTFHFTSFNNTISLALNRVRKKYSNSKSGRLKKQLQATDYTSIT